MAINPGTVAIGAQVVLELLRFARDMREIWGEDATDEKIAEAWERSSRRTKAVADAWRNAPGPDG